MVDIDSAQAMWSANDNSEVNKNFEADVNLELAGLPFSGKIDADVNSTQQFKVFENTMQKTCSCDGGNVTLGNSICAGTKDNLWDVYSQWSLSTERLPHVTNLKTESLWSLMEFSTDDAIAGYADDISTAFDFIVSHPTVHQTAVAMTVNSDWAQFDLLSPSAYIVRDERNPPPEGIVIFEKTKIQWKSPGGQVNPGHNIRIE